MPVAREALEVTDHPQACQPVQKQATRDKDKCKPQRLLSNKNDSLTGRGSVILKGDMIGAEASSRYTTLQNRQHRSAETNTWCHQGCQRMWNNSRLRPPPAPPGDARRTSRAPPNRRPHSQMRLRTGSGVAHGSSGATCVLLRSPCLRQAFLHRDDPEFASRENASQQHRWRALHGVDLRQGETARSEPENRTMGEYTDRACDDNASDVSVSAFRNDGERGPSKTASGDVRTALGDGRVPQCLKQGTYRPPPWPVFSRMVDHRKTL